ncbi:Ras-related protein Rab-6A [Tritrichomonas foetus]|uniref:Ras-related protein Rab-6A n=1 Tax=Tritrichomonas foetus TaxID=1144522 RepID=A0A1J4KD46_9EUKA|nr:Ras-related protein Rab-6A [Tritrichomonas foetus]|eukprot:OHT07574.1 Ras-related protein Rab-6A [Tritrichomonas foetus]
MRSFKCVFLGASCVGKTSIANRYCFDTFTSDAETTIGVDFISKKVVIQDKTINLQIWDTAGQEKYQSIIPAYIRDCSLALIVFDVSDIKTLENARTYVENVRAARGDAAVIALIGNKIDLLDGEDVDKKAKEFANEKELLYFEVSAKDGTNITSMFKALCKNILHLSEKSEVPSAIVLTAESTSESRSCWC